jgi:hypothetical protein
LRGRRISRGESAASRFGGRAERRHDEGAAEASGTSAVASTLWASRNRQAHGRPQRGVRRGQPRAETLQGAPDDAPRALERENRAAEPRQVEAEENDDRVRDDEERDLDGKNATGVDPERAQPAGRGPRARVSRDTAQAVSELPGQSGGDGLDSGLRRPEAERRDDAAAHGDAVDSPARPMRKRSR